MQQLPIILHVIVYLVGGFNPSEKYSSVGMMIPNIWENKSHVPVTTNQIHSVYRNLVAKKRSLHHYIPPHRLPLAPLAPLAPAPQWLRMVIWARPLRLENMGGRWDRNQPVLNIQICKYTKIIWCIYVCICM